VDFESMSLALTNLLDNAMKYSGEAKEIEIRLEQRDGFVRLAVTDHGIGIPREEQKKIFEKFYRVSTGLVHDVKGSGLGLSIVQHIVEAHCGKITVESEAGQGSTFMIHLPVQEEHGTTNEEKGSFVVPPSGGFPAEAGTTN
jgi:signal transduction histidine kinase